MVLQNGGCDEVAPTVTRAVFLTTRLALLMNLRTRVRELVRVFAVLVILARGSWAWGEASITVVDGVHARLTGVSSDGSVVVGGRALVWPLLYEAVRWTAGGGTVGLGDLPGGEFSSQAYGVSGDGSVIIGPGNSGSGTEAFRWTAGGGMVGLGSLLGSGFSSVAYGVNGDGSVVVGESQSRLLFPPPVPLYAPEAFRWTAGTGMVGLGDLPGGEFDSEAKDVSSDGSVVVGYGKSVSGTEAFRWTAGGGMVGLGDLPGGEFESRAFAVSGDGSVVVGASLYGSAVGVEAFRWTAGGGMVGLGDLPGHIGFNAATSVNDDGSVVGGYASRIAGGTNAFLWTAETGMQRLWDVLLREGVNPATLGWSALDEVSGMSADGRTLVGYGERNGQAEGFVVVIPEPTELSLVGCAAIVLCRRRRRAF
jgi:probable HAF family extracellular repeat protein